MINSLLKIGIHWGLTCPNIPGKEKTTAAGQMLALSIVNEVRCSSPLLPLLPCAFASRFHSNLNK